MLYWLANPPRPKADFNGMIADDPFLSSYIFDTLNVRDGILVLACQNHV